MAKLVFHVQADYAEVIKLRNEIEKLKKELKNMDATQSPAAFNTLNTQLSASTKRMDELVANAAKAGAEIDGNFKKKIFDASQTVNGLTEKIIAQKSVVKDVEADVKRLGEAYRIALKRNPLSAGSKLEEYNAARKALDEEKSALFGLTQQQAEARLSVKRLRDEYSLYNDDVKEVVESNNGIAISWEKALAIIGGAGVLKALGSEMIRVRGEFQAADTAIQTLLGSKEKADALMSKVREYAKISPLEFSDVTQATQMMLGFNIEAEKVPRFLQAIGDVSMGDTQKFNSLTLAFSQMSAAGKLMGQDLNQMINAGFNPLQTISEKTGKSIAQLKEEMSKGAISAEMVQQAFIDATSAGGKFYQMSENASKIINGQLSMMQDAMDAAFNEMGQKSEGVIMSSIQMTTSLIENYETIGKVLSGLVATYGTYRTAVMLTTLATSKHTISEIALTNARVLARKAQMALNAAMLTNPYVLLATAVVGLGTAMWAFSDSTTAAEKAQRRFNEQQKEAAKQEQEHKQRIDELVNSSRDIALSDLQRGQSLAELRKEYPKIFSQYDIESIKLADILELKRQIAEEDSKRAGERVAKDFKAANKAVSDYENTLSAKQINGGKLTQQEINKLKELRSYRDQFLVERGKGISEQFISSLKNVDISKFDEYISELENKIEGQGESGKIKLRLPIDVKGSLSDEAIYEVKDIKNLIDTAKSTKQTRIESEKNKTTYQQDLAAAKSDWEKAKKGYEAILKDQKATSEQVKNARDEMQAKEKAYKDLGGETGSSLTKQENQAKKEAKEQFKQQEQLAEQLLSLRRKNQQDEINLMEEGTEKKLTQIDLDYHKELDAIEKQREEWKKAQKGKLTDDQETQLSASEENAFKAYQKSVDEVNKAKLESDRKAWQEYFIEFGNYQEKRKNLILKYDDEIAKASNEGEKESLKKRLEKELQTLDLSELKIGMDWEQVFGNLDKVSTDTLKKLKANLKDFISSQKDLSPENLKELVDAIERIDDKVSERNPFETMSVSFKSLKDATDAQREAQEAYNKALKEGTDEEKKNAKATLESAKNSRQKALFDATDALHKGVDEIGQYVDAGNQVIGIMETLGMKTPEWLEGTMSGFGEMLNGLGNIDLMKPMSIVTGSLQAIKGALTSITSLGGVINWNGSNAKEVQDSIKRLTDRNEALQTSIEDLTDEIKASMGTKSVAAYKDAYEYQKETNENYKKIAQEQARYVGSHHSWNYYWDGFSQNQISDFSRKIGREWNGDIWNLSPEEMKMLRETVDMWEQIQNTGKGGYGDRLTGKLDAYIDQAGKLEELTNALHEGLTGMSFDSMYDSFVSSLMDMEKSAEDVADDISKYFMQAMLSNAIGEQFSDKLRAWYNKFGESMKNDGTLDEREREDLMKEYMKYVDEAMKLRDELAAATGYDKISQEPTSQSSTSRGFGTEMTHEDAGELSGRFTALQIAGEEIKTQNIAQSQSLNLLTARADAILSMNTETRNIADDTRDLIAQSYLELVQISENTGNSAKYLKDIKADIAEVKKNTSKL